MSLRTVALTAALAAAMPAWAQAPISADDLNRQELNRLAGMAPAPVGTTPPIGYSVVSPAAAPPQVLVPPPDYASYPFADRYPFFWLYRYYGYQPPATYEYINSGPNGYYAPVYGLLDGY